MTIDSARRMIFFNDGEEMTFDDLNKVQGTMLAKMYDELVASKLPALNKDPQFGVGLGSNPENYAFAMSGDSAYFRKGSGNNKILIAPGTLLQFLTASPSPDFPSWAAWESDGTQEFAIANGSSSPRVDILQMKLQWIQTGLESRAIKQSGTKAILDMGSLAVNFNSVYRARVAGASGNHITIATQKRTSGSGVTYSENGNAITILYEDGVSTCALVDAAVTASSTLLDIDTSGTPGNVLHDPVDTVAATPLAGGTDDIIIASNVDKAQKVTATINVKTGTPGATPQVPDPDAGFVVLCAILVPALFDFSTHQWVVFDNSAWPVLFDQRIPLGLRVSRTGVTLAQYQAADWTVDAIRSSVTCSTSNPIHFPCQIGGQVGRLIAVQLSMAPFAGETVSVTSEWDGSSLVNGIGTKMNSVVVGSLAAGVVSQIDYLNPSSGSLEAFDTALNRATKITRNSKNQGACMWTNGLRAAYAEFFTAGGVQDTQTFGMALSLLTPHVGTQIKEAIFYIAGG